MKSEEALYRMRKLHVKSLKDLATINYRTSIQSTNVHCLSVGDRCLAMILCIIFLLVLSIGSTDYYVQHVRSNFTAISDNKPMTSMIHHTLQGNHTYHIIFYNSDCSHCQHLVPPNYLVNKISGYHIQYRNIQSPTNITLANKTGGLDVPLERDIIYKNHHYTVHTHPLRLTSKFRMRMFMIIFFIMILLISYVFPFVIL